MHNKITIKLGEICNLMTGGTPSRSHPEYFTNGSIKWLVSGDIHKGEIRDCDGRITESGLKNSNARMLPVNSVLIALNGQGKTRATVAMLRTEATCNQSIVSIYPKDDAEVLPEYIYWNLKGRYEELRRLTGDDGNDRRGLNMVIIRNIEIPVPPSIEEQRRTVERLNAAFAKIDQATKLIEKNIINSDLLFDSMLRELLIESTETETRSIGEVADVEYGLTEKSKSTGYYRLVRITDIDASGLLRDSNKVFVPENAKTREYILQKEDIVVARTGATYGKVLYFQDDEPAVFASYLIRIKFKQGIRPKLFWYFSKTTHYWSQAKILSRGTAQPQFNGNALKKIKFTYPTRLVNQDAIINQLDERYVQTANLRSKYQKKVDSLLELKRILLTQAFSESNVK